MSENHRQLPPNWNKYVHLNGEIYFYNKNLRFVTTEDIYDPAILDDLMAAREEHLEVLEDEDILAGLPDDWEFHLFALEFGGHTGMYSAKHGRAIGDTGLFEHEISSWQYIQEFPMHRQSLPPNAEVKFLSALAYGANERILDHKDTVFPFTDFQTERIVSIYQDLKALQSELNVVPALAWHIGTVMLEIENSRHMNKYGTREARAYRKAYIPEPTWKVQAFDVILFLLLFGAHTTYRKRLEAARPQGFVDVPHFRKFIQSLLVEWADSNLLATVFVSANVGVLALPGVNTLQRNASLVSTLFALMSMISGVFHVWQHRSKTEAEFLDAQKYLHHFQAFSKELDLTVTACFLSLPLVSLLWSVVSFTVSVAAFCVQNSGLTGRTILMTLLSILGSSACATSFFFWHMRQSPLKEASGSGTRVGGWREKAIMQAKALLRPRNGPREVGGAAV